MAYLGYLRLGDVELANNARAAAYMSGGFAPYTMEMMDGGEWHETHLWAGDAPYRTPAEDRAPWFDAGVPASADFGGVMVTRLEGLDTTALEQPVTQSSGDGGSAGARRLPTREIRVEALLAARSSAGLAFGLRWLTRALMGDGCDGTDGVQPRDLTFLDYVPDYRQTEFPEQTRARADEAARMLSSVVCVQAPEVKERVAGSHLRRDGGQAAVVVEFVLEALVPRIWRSPRMIVQPLALDAGDVIGTRFQPLSDDGSCPSQCVDDGGVLTDPDHGPLWTLPRPAALSANVGCQLLDSRRTVIRIPEGVIPTVGEMLPTVEFATGPQAERHLRLRWVRGWVTDDSDEAIACRTVGEAMVTYVPADSRLTLDGRSGRATVSTPDGGTLDATPVTVGRAGAPWRPARMTCGSAYTLLVDTDVDVSPEASLAVVGVTGEV